ncbi:MAG: hypothetical protein HFE96_02680 [Acutalibacter sp.]|nr:hypothetical protein [Acutalibacter sp.]
MELYIVKRKISVVYPIRENGSFTLKTGVGGEVKRKRAGYWRTILESFYVNHEKRFAKKSFFFPPLFVSFSKSLLDFYPPCAIITPRS